MKNRNHLTVIKIRHFLMIAQQVLGLILLALEIYEHVKHLL